MDPLSITASSIALLQVCSSILHICYNTHAILKCKPWCLSRVQDEVRELRGVLETIFQMAVDNQDSKEYPDEYGSLRILSQSQQNRGPLVLCLEDLRALESILLEKYTDQPKTKLHAAMRAISWDISEKEIKQIIDRLARSKSTLNLAISADEVTLLLELRKLSSSMENDVFNIGRTLADLTTEVSARHINERQEKILRWLSPVDPWELYAPAMDRCHDGTGQWFLDSTVFQDWRDHGGPNLWLSGFPGSGKTVLISNIIRDLSQWAQQEEKRPTIAYFYCDFRNSKSQDLSNLLGSVIRQILLKSGEIPSLVEEEYCLSTVAGFYRKPHVAFLLETLQLLSSRAHLIVVIDALDEIEEQTESLCFLRKVFDTMNNVRFLVTSRETQDIRQSLQKFRNIRIEDYVLKVDEDIAKYIDYRLRVDPNLQWLNDHIKGQVSKSMQTQAAGMFRWVQCQLEAFSKLRTIKAIRNSLTQLPQDLHETYDRILARVPKADQESARRILLWVAFAVTPLTLEEIHTAIAIDPQMSHLDEESLLRSPHDILDLVGGLVNVTNEGHITLAHMSVKDYLLSPQATNGFSLSIEKSYVLLFRCCMAYISFNDFKVGPSTTSEDYLERVRKYPLLRHAAISWPYYYRAAIPSDDLNSAVMRLFQEENHKLFMSWVQIINADNPFSWDFYPRHATSLYYASTFGLTGIVQKLIELNIDLNLPGSRYGGTALHGAVYRLHTPVVKLLLEAGADVNKADFLKVAPLHTAGILGGWEFTPCIYRYIMYYLTTCIYL
ncbi:uncharacterized protein F4807DRAFT_451294 [Annulohypoxylon truncatum]|uniref:uncharacterized protein n=1 Tax=Annulohypoxylon truncatum TaxID=327061 RepID=UPI0020074D47|nr:uncharacterized protein F4807DRAFT_451294 [Annulohypoxylon truncatum]KAI1210758.1 hypothetical protein F4807DRAFT_451294 [Annulohypoxylon truncatum]